MTVQQLPFLLPYILSLAITTTLGIFTWRRHRVVGAKPFAIAIFLQSSMTLGYILELIGSSQSEKILWDDFQWIGTLTAPVAILMFALAYSGNRPRRPARVWALLLTPPAIFIVLLVTNGWHGWVRPVTELVPGAPFSTLTYEFTPVVYIASLFIYATALAAFYYLFRLLIHGQKIYRSQALAVIVGTSMPLLGGLLTLANVTLTFQRDLTPITFAIGNSIIAWALFRYRLFDLTPVAWETVVGHIRDAVVVLDAQDRVVDLNPAGRALMPQTRNRAIGVPVIEFLAEWTDLVARFQDVSATSDEISVGLGDNRRDLEIDIVPLYSRRRHYIGRIVVLHDITERKRAESDLRQRGEELEAANRRLDAARQTAEAAQLKAEEADRVKSQFLASMSHELRTPLNAIINFTEMIMLEMIGPVTDSQKELLEQSLDSSTHLLNLINDVLDISKIQAGKLRLLVEEGIQIEDSVEPVLGMIAPLLKDKPVVVVRDIDRELPAISGDRRRIRQIMLNLLTNAAKFTTSGSITISLKRRPDHILLAVTDTGPGIAPEMQTRIFEPFVQTVDGLKHAEGTGLGLPITRSLVTAHGGEMWLESEMGEGTAFYVRLPLEAVTAVVEE